MVLFKPYYQSNIDYPSFYLKIFNTFIIRFSIDLFLLETTVPLSSGFPCINIFTPKLEALLKCVQSGSRGGPAPLASSASPASTLDCLKYSI